MRLLRSASSSLAAELRRITRPGSLIILICNERHLDEDNEHLLRRLNGTSRINFQLPLSDPLEHHLPALAQASFSIG